MDNQSYRIWRLLILFLVTGFASVFVQANAEETTIAVASNFTAAANKLIAEFENQSDHKVNLVFGSSGRFFAQIANGAPFDAFLSADQEKPAALLENSLALDSSLFTYAVGTLVLWSTDVNKVDNSAAILSTDSFNKLAIANPRLAPYGVAATEVIQYLGLSEDISGKLVIGENIAQAYQFVATANADIGFVAFSQVLTSGQLSMGSAWIVPEEMYQPIRQDAVLLNRGESNRAASAFLEFLRSDQGQTIIQANGYKTVEQ